MHTEKILDDLIKKTMDEIDPIDLYRNKIIERVNYWLWWHNMYSSDNEAVKHKDLISALDKDIKNKVHKLIKKEK